MDDVFLNDKSKRLTYFNRNYFFVTTVFFVLLNIFLYMFAARGRVVYEQPDWYSFSIKNQFVAFAKSFEHANLQHCMLNMLCFFIAGIYLERKKGSLNFMLFVLFMSFFTAFASSTNAISIYWRGFSGVNYGIYGYIIIDYISVLLCKRKRYLFNIVSGAVILALIYFAMCFCGGTSTVSFKPYPYDLINNIGHESGLFAGLIFGIYETVAEALHAKTAKNKEDPER